MKYAFIDVQNTESTTKQLLGFEIDRMRLFTFLKNDWECEKVFFYSGIDAGDMDTTKQFEELSKSGCLVCAKIVFAYKNRDKTIKSVCSKCGNEFISTIDMGYNRKSNCDVDLTVDAMDNAKEGNEFYLFSGDGDFEYLIRKVIEKGTLVHIVSSAKKIKSGPKYFTSRFSTKLRKLIDEFGKPVDFLNIDNIRKRIEKIRDLETL
jgi:uncharacterized LabA/DUF88 family protein